MKIKYIVKRMFKEVNELLIWTVKSIHSKIKGQHCKKLRKINAEKIVIAGNGPSTNEFDFMKYKKEQYEFLCVNFFAVENKDFFNIKPKFYCIIDPVFYSDEVKDCKLELKIKELNKILQLVDWDMTFISLVNQKLKIINKNIRQVQLNNCIYCGEIKKIKKYLYDNNKANCGYQNVINASLYYLISCNVKKILLIGVETDWHREIYIDENNDLIRVTRHFYGEEKINCTELGEVRKGEWYKYIYYYYLTVLGLKRLADYGKNKNIKIVNLCLNSYIDVFPKEKMERDFVRQK